MLYIYDLYILYICGYNILFLSAGHTVCCMQVMLSKKNFVNVLFKLRTVHVLHVKVPSVHIIYILHFTHIFIYFTLFRITTRYYMYALPSYCYASSVVLHVTSECGVHVHTCVHDMYM